MRTVHTLRVGDAVEITNDLECGNADFIRAVGPQHVEVGPRDDGVPHELQVKGPLSCYNVCVLLRNDAPGALSLTVDVIIPPWLIEAGMAKFLRNVYFERDANDVRWTPLPPGEDLGGRMRFDLDLPAGARRVFSSVPQLPYSACVRRLGELSTPMWEAAPAGDSLSPPNVGGGSSRRLPSPLNVQMPTQCGRRLQPATPRLSQREAPPERRLPDPEPAADAPTIRLCTIGHSTFGRPVHALRLGPSDGRPRVVVMGTLQAGEPTAWAVLAAADWLLDTDEGRRHLETFRIDLVPVPNPDGNVLGRCNVNGEGVLSVMRFPDAAAGRPCPVETQLVWDFMAHDPPLGYIEFHMHRLANHASCTMGFPDDSLYDDQERAARTDAAARHMATHPEHGRVHRWSIDDPFWSNFCVYHTAHRLNIVTCIDQYTGPGSSLEGLQRRAPAILAAFLAGLAAGV